MVAEEPAFDRMSLLDVLGGMFGDDPDITIRVYECRECGRAFESAKSPDRVQCVDCLSDDVTPIDPD